MTWATKYIGLPFAEGGRGPNTFDCWGLVRAVLLAECGIEVEPFADIETYDSPAVAERVKAEIERTDWIRVDQSVAQPFDVALMWVERRLLGRNTARSLSHIGIVVEPRKMLHSEEHMIGGSCIEKFARVRPLGRIHSFYRHRRLA